MSKGQVVRYFARAIFITAEQHHHDYDWSPCYVRGTAIIDKQSVTWQIDAGESGWVKFPDATERLIGQRDHRSTEG